MKTKNTYTNKLPSHEIKKCKACESASSNHRYRKVIYTHENGFCYESSDCLDDLTMGKTTSNTVITS